MLQILFAAAVIAVVVGLLEFIFALEDLEGMTTRDWLQFGALALAAGAIGGLLHGGLVAAWTAIAG